MKINNLPAQIHLMFYYLDMLECMHLKVLYMSIKFPLHTTQAIYVYNIFNRR